MLFLLWWLVDVSTLVTPSSSSYRDATNCKIGGVKQTKHGLKLSNEHKTRHDMGAKQGNKKA